MDESSEESIRAQIAALQAKLPGNAPASPKRKGPPERAILAPGTPPAKKRQKLDHNSGKQQQQQQRRSKPVPVAASTSTPAPSNLISKLAKINSKPDNADIEKVSRSTGFHEPPPPPIPAKRDENLALVEEFEVGPIDHKPPFDDPNFENVEPNSGIRLLSRSISHEDLQNHLSGRFYLSPSRLYACIRLLPDKQGYEVPTPGDWITIAVVAERGPIKYTQAPVGIGPDEDLKKKKGKEKEKETEKSTEEELGKRHGGKKFINFKLVDFGSRSSSSATGGKSIIRGDAMLSLLLFESDGFDVITSEEGGKPRKLYKGGSRGAFEAMSKVQEGHVIALLNPRVLKPYQKSSSDKPHPQTNILALTPESADSISVIGRSKDLGICTAIKRDGKRCESWCDKRINTVCDFHLQSAVTRQRASRPEFSRGTAGMSNSATVSKRDVYDPAKKVGLRPKETVPGTGATYVVSGHVVRGSSDNPASSLFISENMGREGQAKAARKMAAADSEKTLKSLLGRDKEGMKAVMRAREAGKMLEEGKEIKFVKRGRGEMEMESEEGSGGTRSYAASVIKELGFDPVAMKVGSQRNKTADVQKKLDALAALQATKTKDVKLGPRPGDRIRSGVIAPPTATGSASAPKDTEGFVNLDSDD